MAETEKERPRERGGGSGRVVATVVFLILSLGRALARLRPPSLSLRLSIGLRGAAEPVAFAFTVPLRGAQSLRSLRYHSGLFTYAIQIDRGRDYHCDATHTSLVTLTMSVGTLLDIRYTSTLSSDLTISTRRTAF